VMTDSTGIGASMTEFDRDLKSTWQRWTGFKRRGSLVGWVLTVGVFAVFAVSQISWMRLQAPGGRYWFEREEWLGFCLRVHVWCSIRKITCYRHTVVHVMRKMRC
jgi:hypothetical protein